MGIGIFTPPILRAEMQTWTDATGKHKVEAEFISLEGGNVSLKTAEGKTITLELAKLSEADQTTAKNFASGEKTPAAGEAPAAPSDIKISAKGKLLPWSSSVNGVQKTSQKLSIEVTALGGAAAQAYSIGPVVAAPLTVDGKILKVDEAFHGSDGFDLIDRNADGFLQKHPKDGITVSIQYGEVAESVTSVGPVKGSVKVMSGGTATTVEIKDLLNHPTTVLSDPQIAAMGLAAKFTRSNHGDDYSLGVELTGKGQEMFAGLELVGADGKNLEGGYSNMSGMGKISCSRDTKKEHLKGATLKLNLRKGGKMVEIPFNLPQVEVGK